MAMATCPAITISDTTSEPWVACLVRLGASANLRCCGSTPAHAAEASCLPSVALKYSSLTLGPTRCESLRDSLDRFVERL